MMNKKPTCYIPIEVKRREIDSKIYLALQLACKGYPCIVGRKGAGEHRMYKSREPFILFSKGLSPHNCDYYSAICDMNGAILEIQEEANNSRNDRPFLYSHDQKVVPYVAGFCLWGKHPQTLLINNREGISEDSAPVTGQPTFDLLLPDVVKYYDYLSQQTVDVEKGFILINTNFARYNNVISFEDAKALNYKIDLFDDDLKKEWDELRGYHKELLSEYLKMIKALAESFPTKVIVVRPHPAERIETYLEELSNYTNVKVTQKGSVREWIVNASLVIHHDCTTGIEALLAGAQVISYCPILNSEITQRLSILVCTKIYNLEDIIKSAEMIFEGKVIYSKEEYLQKLKKLKHYIHNVDEPAYQRIIGFIEKYSKAWFFKSKILYIRGRVKLFIFQVRRKFSYFFLTRKRVFIKGNRDSDRNIKRYRASKFSGISLKEIEERISIFKKIQPDLPVFKVEQIGDSAFSIVKSVL